MQKVELNKSNGSKNNGKAGGGNELTKSDRLTFNLISS